MNEIDLSKIGKDELLELLSGLYRTQHVLNECIVSCQSLLHMVTVFENREFHPIRTVEDGITDPFSGVREEGQAAYRCILAEAYRLASVSDRKGYGEDDPP